ncbi:MAG: hypothetical protein P4L11_13700 [Geothrix sp.]|nr:hypothetical protein [Geothrix sp.]
MPKATSTRSTLALNSSNHASIPKEGLELLAGVPTSVTAAQAAYLKTLRNVVVEEDGPAPRPVPIAPSAPGNPA